MNKIYRLTQQGINAAKFWAGLLMVKFHTRADRRMEAELLDAIAGQAYDLLQLWEKIAAVRETPTESEDEPLSLGTVDMLMQPRED